MSKKLISLVDKLNALGRAINARFREINHGGCCVYAAAIGRMLQAKKVKCSVVAYGWESDPGIDYVRAIIEANREDRNDVYNWVGHGVMFWHVAVKFEIGGESFYYDSNGVVPSSNKARFGSPWHTVLDGEFTVDEAQAFADDPSGWNRCFDRNDIPEIMETIKAAFAPKKRAKKVLAVA